jgi:hypothetical protein|tara:strand:- start:92221 stop:93045 length:825 start_codon:yes stop_codon:yes gene_type:complete
MKGVFSVFRFYINASIHVAFAVLALFWITVLEFELEVPTALWLFVFFGTITGYNFVKYAKVAGLHHRSLAQSLRAIQVFSALSFAVLFFSVFYLKINTLLVAIGFGLFTFFYAVPLLKRKNLRTLSGLKIMIVALVWAGVTIMVPVVEDGMSLTNDFFIAFLQRFLLVIVLTIPFEIRDLAFDRLKLQTLPQRLGVLKTKILGAAFLVVILMLEGFKDVFSTAQLYALIVLVLFCGIALMVSKKEQSRYFASFWIESIPIVWLLSWCLFRHFLA